MRKIVSSLLAASTLAATVIVSPAVQASEGNSVGHGVKCYWVQVAVVNGVAIMQQVCRKGI